MTSDNERVRLWKRLGLITISAAPSLVTMQQGTPGLIPIDPLDVYIEDQLTFDDWDPEWADNLEKTYGIKPPCAPD